LVGKKGVGLKSDNPAQISRQIRARKSLRLLIIGAQNHYIKHKTAQN